VSDASEKHRRMRRTWPQRMLLTFNAFLVLSCLGAAGGLWFALDKASHVQRLTFAPNVLDPVTTATTSPGGTLPPDTGNAPPAQNFLVVGTDSRNCVDPKSPYAGAFLGDGTNIGTRTDTILVVRLDAASNQAIIMSFPRDLWVRIGNHNQRINTAWAESPATLIETIKTNFDIPINHYVDVDFCAFKGVVDALGGVSVPFATPVRDLNTGLDVTQAGCHTMMGDEALAYTRSRHFEWYDATTKTWIKDGTSDYGRIRRQQDFVKRALHKALDKGATDLGTLNSLINVALATVRVDQSLTFNEMFTLARRLRTLDANAVPSFFIQGQGTVIDGADVILPNVNSQYNRAVLDLFRGKAKLADVPDPNAETTTTRLTPATSTTVPFAAPTTTASGSRPVGRATTSTVATSTTVPVITVPTTISPSITPLADPTCR